MTLTIAHLKDWYNEFKALVFDNDMPAVTFKLTNTRKTLGQAINQYGRYTIKISLFWDRNEEQFRNCLLHEMCHIWCYYHGYHGEHHTGPHWVSISNKATRITGLYIQRCEDNTGWKAAGTANQKRLEAVKARREAPSILVDFDYGSYHFIVKTTKSVVAREYESYSRNRKVSVYISDNPRFTSFQNSRSLHRGYKYPNWEYENKIAPLIKKAVKVENPNHLVWGQYDFLGIR
jgi:predicted SprT family Zn-dependent metalloprotease